jgi:hypothetical protein
MPLPMQGHDSTINFVSSEIVDKIRTLSSRPDDYRRLDYFTSPSDVLSLRDLSSFRRQNPSISLI